MFTENGVLALSEGLITLQQARLHRNSNSIFGSRPNLSFVLSDMGLELLRKKLMTVEDAAYLQDTKLLSTTYSNAIKEGHITIKMITNMCRHFYPFELDQLVNSNTLPLLQDGTISYQPFFEITDRKPLNNLYYGIDKMISGNGYKMLKQKLITLKEMASINSYADLPVFLSDECYHAFQCGVVKLKDFNENGRFCNMLYSTFKEYYHKKLLLDIKFKDQKFEHPAITIQSFFRQQRDSRKKQVLVSIKNHMFSANIHQLDDLVKAKDLAFSNKIIDAEQVMSGMKKK